MATSNDSSVGPPDFSEAWMFSDVVLVVEDQKFHVHRFVLALWSPVFKMMFTSEFREKRLCEIPLPDKKASEIKKLLLIIYPTVSEKGWESVTNDNCYFLFKLADEYQMDTIKQRCEDFLVKKVTSAVGNAFLNELRFAQSHKSEKLVQTIVDKAVCELRLDDFKSHAMYNEIEPDIYKQIVEGMIKKYENSRLGTVVAPPSFMKPPLFGLG